MNRLLVAAAVLAAASSISALQSRVTYAHEHRDLGEYSLVVGFLVEPALVGEPNGLDLRVSKHAGNAVPAEDGEHADDEGEEAGTPVEGLESTLKAEVIVGGGAQTMPLELEPRFGQPGAYVAHFIPTRAGDYSFRIYGTIEGMEVDERFDSGPETFSPVNDTADLQFPNKIPSAGRLDESIRQLGERLAALEASDGDDGRANLGVGLGAAGVLAGAVGLGAGLIALMRSRR